MADHICEPHRMSVLYISYDGMLEPLGQSQVLAYLKRLADGKNIHLISFEKAEDWAKTQERNRIAIEVADAGIVWHPLRYHKWPSALATGWDICCGIAVGLWLVLRYRLRIVHARSYVPAVIALVLKRVAGVKFVFDMRGFWADERVDGNLWPKGGQLYRVAKWFEQHFLLSADRVVSLTQAAVDDMRQFPYLQGRMPSFEIITTCTDLDLFKPDMVAEQSMAKINRPFTIGYVGSVGVWYLFDETIKCYKLLQRMIPDVQLHILNRGDHPYIQERLIAHQVELESVKLEMTDHVGVAHAMCQMDAGIFFIKPAYSKIASAPTKLGEFLGCGVPCISNTGVGDMAAIMESNVVGVAMQDFGEEVMTKGLERLLQLVSEKGIRQRCRQVALDHFSLEKGVQTYADMYSSLLNVEKL